MSGKRAPRHLAIFALVSGLLAAGAGPALAASASTESRLPRLPLLAATCEDVQTRAPFARDGKYTLFTNNTILSVYCHDMAGTPREYISLAHTGADANFSQYTAGEASPGTDVRTSFTKLRIDPSTLTVDIGDLTFASSTGSLAHSGDGNQQVTAMPYGVAMSCTAGPDGVANIDLRGTPFTVADTFVTGGFAASGSDTRSANNQVIALNGGGYCGWITPDPPMYNPFNPQPGDFRLTLECAPRGTAPGQVCLKY